MDSSTPDKRIIKSYVWHGDDCYFVSTIERDSSAMEGPRRYNETLVWRYDWEKKERAEHFIAQVSDFCGGLAGHFRACRQLHSEGVVYEE